MRHTPETFPADQLADLLRVAQNIVHLHDIGTFISLREITTHRDFEGKLDAIENLRSIVFTPDPPPKSGVTIDHSGFFV